jgi:hypothetical protein
MDKQGVKTTQKGVCGACNKPIVGQVLQLDKQSISLCLVSVIVHTVPTSLEVNRKVFADFCIDRLLPYFFRNTFARFLPYNT